MEKNIENCIEWLTGQEKVTLSLTSKRHISKIKKLCAKDSACDFEENNDGSIVAHIPLTYVKFTPKRTRNNDLSEEERANIKAAFAAIKNSRQN